MTAIALTHRQDIIDRVSRGEYVKDIAIDLGVTKQALSQVLKDDPEYQIAKEEGMAERLDRAHSQLAEVTEQDNIELGDAKPLLDLARIREIGIKRLEWRAEREFPNRWGAQKININVINGVSMDVALAGEAGALLDKLSDHS